MRTRLVWIVWIGIALGCFGLLLFVLDVTISR